MTARASRPLILVDGRSGAGKTHWATALSVERGFTLISLDDIYPGWDGLDAGHWFALTYVIRPWLAGKTARIRHWDWEAGRLGAEVTVSPDDGLVVEGCGALSRLTAPHATDRYWLETDSELRKQRALARDGEMFRPHWQRWALQEERFYRLHRSRELADTIITT